MPKDDTLADGQPDSCAWVFLLGVQAAEDLEDPLVVFDGDADAVAFASAINVARMEVEQKVPQRIRSLLAHNLGE